MENLEGYPKSIARDECKIGRKVTIVSTIEYKSGHYETIAMNRNGKEFDLIRTPSLKEALDKHVEWTTKYSE